MIFSLLVYLSVFDVFKCTVLCLAVQDRALFAQSLQSEMSLRILVYEGDFMKASKITIACALVLLFVSTASRAVFYYAEVWMDDAGDILIVLWDYHMDEVSLKTTKKQHADLVSKAKQYNFFGIFEDDKNKWTSVNDAHSSALSSWKKQVARIPAPIRPDMYVGISSMRGMGASFEKEGLRSLSVEFRFFLDNPFTTVSDALKWLTALIKDVRENKHNIAHESAYDAYRFYLDYSLRNEKRLMEVLKEAVASAPDQLFSEFVSGVQGFDYPGPDIEYGFYGLIDAKLFYALYDQKKNGIRDFVIAAGGAHIEAIAAGLISLGYKKIKSEGVLADNPLIGSIMDESLRSMTQKEFESNTKKVIASAIDVAPFFDLVMKERDQLVASEREAAASYYKKHARYPNKNIRMLFDESDPKFKKAQLLYKTAMSGDERGLTKILEGDGFALIDTYDFQLPFQDTALGYAARNENSDMVALLLDREADVNARNGSGTTALMTAVRKHDLETVRELLGRCADLNAKDHAGDTVESRAEKRNDVSTLEWLSYAMDKVGQECSEHCKSSAELND